MLSATQVIEAFKARYDELPEVIVRAPGWVNLIGEHTDYNEGFGLAMAIERATYIAASHRVDRLVRAYSRQFEAEDRFTLEAIERSEVRPWANAIRGVTKGFIARDLSLFGANLLIDSELPLGSGLGGSAALEVAVGYALQLLNTISLLGEELALLAHGAEQSFVGGESGIMGQFVAALGQAGHALLIDCRDLSYRPLAMPTGVCVLLCDSGVRQEPAISSTIYQERQSECAEAVRLLAPALPSRITALRDVTPAALEAHAALLSPDILARARHAVGENQRVLAAAEALAAADRERFGALMYESHASLRYLYQVSLPELDLLVELAHRQPGCYGARMSGVGLGGNVICLVNASSVESFSLSMTTAYQRESGREPLITAYTASEGVGRAGSS